MKSAVILGLACLLVVLMHHSADAAIARCNCSGRCGTFSCSNPLNTKGCDCVNCTCIRGSVGFYRCCKNDCGFWNKTKCYNCHPSLTCNCNGCTSRS